MQKLRFKTRFIDVLICYNDSKETRPPKQLELIIEGKITFKIIYPYLKDSLLEEYSDKLQIEFAENGGNVYFASSPHVILPTKIGGMFKSSFTHPTYPIDISENQRRYINLLVDLDQLVAKAFEDL